MLIAIRQQLYKSNTRGLNEWEGRNSSQVKINNNIIKSLKFYVSNNGKKTNKQTKKKEKKKKNWSYKVGC